MPIHTPSRNSNNSLMATMSPMIHAKQILFALVSGCMMLGYLIQFNIIHDLAEGINNQQQQQQGGGGGNNNNNNMIVMMPIMNQQQQPQGDNVNQQQQETSTNRKLSQQQQQQQQQQAPILPKRQLLQETNVRKQLTQAHRTVPDVVQPALGEGKSNDDPSLYHYSKSFRGLDFAAASSREEYDTIRQNRIIYVITPTYRRRTQMVDLTRLGQTLALARASNYHQRLYWILLEDATACSHRVRQMAIESGIPFAHKAVKTSLEVRRNPKAHRGLEQRNMGLDIVEQVGVEGIVYFMDDDNGYNVQLLHELTYTTHVSVFGVGMPGGSAYERCRVDPITGKVDKLLTTWDSPRKFAVDMAGFAFATHHLHLTKLAAGGKPMRFSQKSLPGYLENDLISFMATSVGELQPLAANCTRILAWHVKTVGNDLYYNPESNKEIFNLLVSLV